MLTYDVLLPLLLEEYQPDDIEKFRANIDDAIRQVNAQQAFRERVRLLLVGGIEGLPVTGDQRSPCGAAVRPWRSGSGSR